MQKNISVQLYSDSEENALELYLITAIRVPLFISEDLSPFSFPELGAGTHPNTMKVDINEGSYKLTHLETKEVFLIMSEQGIIDGSCFYKKAN